MARDEKRAGKKPDGLFLFSSFSSSSDLMSGMLFVVSLMRCARLSRMSLRLTSLRKSRVLRASGIRGTGRFPDLLFAHAQPPIVLFSKCTQKKDGVRIFELNDFCVFSSSIVILPTDVLLARLSRRPLSELPGCAALRWCLRLSERARGRGLLRLS